MSSPSANLLVMSESPSRYSILQSVFAATSSAAGVTANTLAHNGTASNSINISTNGTSNGSGGGAGILITNSITQPIQVGRPSSFATSMHHHQHQYHQHNSNGNNNNNNNGNDYSHTISSGNGSHNEFSYLYSSMSPPVLLDHSNLNESLSSMSNLTKSFNSSSKSILVSCYLISELIVEFFFVL